jgi:hypothetical protein
MKYKEHHHTCKCQRCEGERSEMRTPPKAGSKTQQQLHDLADAFYHCACCGENPCACEKARVEADPWKHRSKGMRCKTCMWFVAKKPPACQADPIPVIDLGRCRRRAPTMDGYPAVFVNDWCGDHKIDENKM